MKWNDAVFWIASVLGIVFILVQYDTQAAQSKALLSHRFEVVSQQIVDSGAKVIVLRDTRQPDRPCYVIYEAGAGVVLDEKSPCK